MAEGIGERRAAGAVRITLPARVTYDPDALKEGIVQLAERIGHPKCFSGADCLIQMEREFLFDQPEPREPGFGRGLNTEAALLVGLAPRVKYDLDMVLEAVDRVIDNIGPHPCISGFDVLFRNQMIVVNEQLEVNAFG
jgi:hypothetical protein